MNRGLNLPAIQKIMNDFEKESSMMDMKEEMMSDAVDDVMDEDIDDEEEEGDRILKQVLDEIGVDLSQQVSVPIIHASAVDVNGCSSPKPPLDWVQFLRQWLKVDEQLPLESLLAHHKVMSVLLRMQGHPMKMLSKLVWMRCGEGDLHSFVQ